MNDKYYKRQLVGLWLILDDANFKDTMISREYVKEKLRMIESGQGIGFHKTINDALDQRGL